MKTNTTLPLKTGGEKLSLNYKIKDFIQSVQGSTIDWQERRLKEFIRSLITHTTEQTARRVREEVLREIIAVAEPYDGAKWLNNLSPKQLEKIILSEPLEKE